TDTRPQASEGVFRAPTAEEGRRLCARLGITPDTTVILYDDEGGLHAAWLFLVLDVLGHPRVSVLDGGSQRWRAGGGAWTTDVPRRSDRYHEWAVQVAEQITAPLLTCEAVLAEAAFHLGDVGVMLMMIEEGLISLAFECRDHLEHLKALAQRYANRRPDLADLCLIRMSELYPR